MVLTDEFQFNQGQVLYTHFLFMTVPKDKKLTGMTSLLKPHIGFDIEGGSQREDTADIQGRPLWPLAALSHFGHWTFQGKAVV